MADHDNGSRDAATLEAMVVAGGDLSRPFTVDHFIEGFRDEATAQAVAEDVAKLGYDVLVVPLDDELGPCVQASHEQMLNEEELGAARAQLIEVADRHGAVYDGWGAESNA
jgi:regulator of RNase E activity RraB